MTFDSTENGTWTAKAVGWRRVRETKGRLAAAAAAAVLLIASPAFACVTFKGSMTVTPIGGSGQGSVTAVGDGYMTYCAGSPQGAAEVLPAGVIAVEVAPATCGTVPTALSGGAYTVSYAPSSAHCMDAVLHRGGDGIDVGMLLVDDAGHGTGTYAVPGLADPGDQIGICITGPLSAGDQPGVPPIPDDPRDLIDIRDLPWPPDGNSVPLGIAVL